MPIAALPANTVRAIGSSQVLTDPCSVVKELIDNALDARATSIIVEISPNTLDVIQVKDNGYGIGPEDRAMVCRRYCTSKIRDLEDLKDVGGRSLGFRGEALASAAEMSVSVVVTTRIEGEAVAVTMKASRNGEVESQERASHPVGTTVRVVDFLKHLPVRRQTAVKTCTKALAKIKQTLQAYAVARPATRLSLKVLKAKSDKSNWMYAPKADASVSDAAMKVVDKNTAGQCHWISWNSAAYSGLELDRVAGLEDVQDDGAGKTLYRIEAFLPGPDASPSIISHAGHFVSVDSRPVSCTRGALKQLVTLYKSYIRAACSKHNEGVTNPFLCLNIVCPLGSYDANVEPAKDDVLFEDSNRLLSIVESFFISVYGELQVVNEEKNRSSNPHVGRKDHKSGFELLLARKPQSEGYCLSPGVDVPLTQSDLDNQRQYVQQSQSLVDGDQNLAKDKPSFEADGLEADLVTTSHWETPGHNRTEPQSPGTSPDDQLAADDDPPSKRRRTWHFNMYGGDEDETEEADDMRVQPVDEDLDTEEGLRDVNVSNPWTIAKMNASIRPIQRALPANATNDVDENGQLMTPARESGPHTLKTMTPKINMVRGVDGSTASNLLTPQRTLRSPSLDLENVSSSNAWNFPSKAWAKAQPGSKSARKQEQVAEQYAAGALDTRAQESVTVVQQGSRHDDEQLPHNSPEDEEISFLAARQKTSNHRNGFISARALQHGMPLSDIPEAPAKRAPREGLRKQQQAAAHKPFISPVNDPHRVWFDMEPHSRAKAPSQARSKTVRDSIAATAPTRFESEDEDIIEEISPLNPIIPARNPKDPTLERLMDYEHRKRAATQEYRASLRNSANLTTPTHPNERGEESQIFSSNSPHKNRYEAAKAALSPSKYSVDNAPQSIFADGDPRAYFIRVKRREDAARHDGSGQGQSKNKLRRAKTMMLPLETIAVDRKVQDLVFTVSIDAPSIKRLEAEASSVDEFVRSGENTCGLLAIIEDIRFWEQRLSTIIETTYKNETGERAKMPFDLWSALQEHMATHA
ncbi:MAG: hypothetical protein M1830_009394 [Pleopsidium flavum]|nr:MAG: hypothetical protein M1830_009394 [Pleopsidium flavum]